jgi:hypothetical protein
VTETEEIENQAGRLDITEEKRKTANELAQLINLRRYAQLCTSVERQIESCGWKETVSLLRAIPVRTNDNNYDVSWWSRHHRSEVFPVRAGKIRDGLLHILGLNCVLGIDVDLLKSFGRLRVKSLEELRNKVSIKAVKLLTSQISRGTTFFLDTGQMRGTPFESLIPQIERQRAQEFTDLGDIPSYSRAVKTYYGFSYLTSSLTKEDTVALAQLSEIPLEFSGKRPSYQRSMFSHCSEELTDLLLNYLRLTFARPQTQVKGAEALGERADFRALAALHASLKKETPDLLWYADPLNRVKYAAIWALGEIGHPSSLEHLRPFVGDFTFDRNALWAISWLSHPDAVDVLLERAFNEPPRRVTCGTFPGVNTSEKELTSRADAVRYLWRFQDERTIGFLVELMKDRSASDSALHSLILMGDLGLQGVRENLGLVRKVAKESHRTQCLMHDLLRFMPDLLGESDFDEFLFEMIRIYPSLLSTLPKVKPSMLQESAFRESLIAVLMKSRNPIDLIGELHGIGILDSCAEFREAAYSKIKDASLMLPRDARRDYLHYDTLKHICAVPILYESELIHEALAKAIQTGLHPKSILHEIKEHPVLSHLSVVHDAVMYLLSSVRWDVWFIKEVVESRNIMKNEQVKIAVSKALSSFWSIRENTRRTVYVDWDTSEYLWVYFLHPLQEYPEMGGLPEFQEAVSNLLKNTCYPEGVLSTVRDFDGLLESELVKKEADCLLADFALSQQSPDSYPSSTVYVSITGATPPTPLDNLLRKASVSSEDRRKLYLFFEEKEYDALGFVIRVAILSIIDNYHKISEEGVPSEKIQDLVLNDLDAVGEERKVNRTYFNKAKGVIRSNLKPINDENFEMTVWKTIKQLLRLAES